MSRREGKSQGTTIMDGNWFTLAKNLMVEPVLRKYHVRTTAVDGDHELAIKDTEAEAIAFMREWAGDHTTWLSPTRGITMYGQDVYISRHTQEELDLLDRREWDDTLTTDEFDRQWDVLQQKYR